MINCTTYPQMNAKITALLRINTENPACLYAADRIEELEAQCATLLNACKDAEELLSLLLASVQDNYVAVSVDEVALMQKVQSLRNTIKREEQPHAPLLELPIQGRGQFLQAPALERHHQTDTAG